MVKRMEKRKAKRILVLSGSPKGNSFSEQLAQSYAAGATQYHEVRVLKISEMRFNPDLSGGYAQSQDLEEDLVDFQAAIEWAEHLVITTPIWWGTLPAKFKGVFDRAFLPGFAFSYEQGKTLPKKLLKGKTARILMTMDTPTWYYRYFQGAPALKQLKITTLEFCGFKAVRSHMIGPIISANDSQKEQWQQMAKRLGEKGK